MAGVTKIDVYIGALALMPIRDLAQQYFEQSHELANCGDATERAARLQMCTAIASIGYVRFPDEWEKARDSAGMDQSVTA